jgi:hypothetical protein
MRILKRYNDDSIFENGIFEKDATASGREKLVKCLLHLLAWIAHAPRNGRSVAAEICGTGLSPLNVMLRYLQHLHHGVQEHGARCPIEMWRLMPQVLRTACYDVQNCVSNARHWMPILHAALGLGKLCGFSAKEWAKNCRRLLVKFQMGKPAAEPEKFKKLPFSSITRFYKLMSELERIRLRRLQGSAPPWTNDKIMAKCRLTNVHRCDDRTIAAIIEKLRSHKRKEEWQEAVSAGPDNQASSGALLEQLSS